MAIYFVTGKLGAGKTLSAVGRIKEYLQKDRIVATNLDIKIEHLLSARNKTAHIYRIPDKPTIENLEALPNANKTYDEERNGLLVLDECGTWFNSRSWNDKSRAPVIDWFLHARKLGWDVLFLVQDISIVDKQAREALCEHLVVCRRLDRLSVPLLSPLVKVITGKRLPLPKLHMAKVHYGDNEQSITVDRWLYRGKDLFNAYDTKQIFTSENNGIYRLLSPWLVLGRYSSRSSWKLIAMEILTSIVTKILMAYIIVANGLGRRPSPLDNKKHNQSKNCLSRYVRNGYEIG